MYAPTSARKNQQVKQQQGKVKQTKERRVNVRGRRSGVMLTIGTVNGS